MQSQEIEKLKREMSILTRMNEEQKKRLEEQKSIYRKRNDDANDLDRKIEDLTNRLRQKKISNAGFAKNMIGNLPGGNMHTIVAAIEPLMKPNMPKVIPFIMILCENSYLSAFIYEYGYWYIYVPRSGYWYIYYDPFLP